MSERRVQLPEAAEDFVMDGLDTSSAAVALFAARKLAQWLVANPQVPTDEQIDSIEFEPCSTARWAKQCITEFQRRFLFAPEEPKVAQKRSSISTNSEKLPLRDCPNGLFVSAATGTLCVKTVYGLDCYIVESGERFWGGARTESDLAEVNVIPVTTEWFEPAEPEDPLADLLAAGPPRATFTQNGWETFSVEDKKHDEQVREAYRRGQQSMITKEKQP